MDYLSALKTMLAGNPGALGQGNQMFQNYLGGQNQQMPTAPQMPQSPGMPQAQQRNQVFQNWHQGIPRGNFQPNRLSSASQNNMDHRAFNRQQLGLRQSAMQNRGLRNIAPTPQQAPTMMGVPLQTPQMPGANNPFFGSEFNQNGVRVGQQEMDQIAQAAQMYNQSTGQQLTPQQYDQMLNPPTFQQRWGQFDPSITNAPGQGII